MGFIRNRIPNEWKYYDLQYTMKSLEERFRRSGLSYTLLTRNNFVALYGIGGIYTDKILHYEVCKIYIWNEKYGFRESIPSNQRFGRDPSRSFNDIESANKYFEELTTRLKLSHRRPEFESELQRKAEIIPEVFSA